MRELRRSSEVTPEDVKDVNIDVTAEIQKVEQKAREREEEKGLLAGSRCPLLGHLVQIAQVMLRITCCDITLFALVSTQKYTH